MTAPTGESAAPAEPSGTRLVGAAFVGVALVLLGFGVAALDPTTCGWAMAIATIAVGLLAHADDRQTGGHR